MGVSLVAAVDPGSAKSALVLFDPKTQTIDSMGIYENEELLKMLRVPNKRIGVFVIELIASYGFAVGREIFDTCIYIGRCLEAVRHMDVTIYPLKRKAVVTHHTGNAKGGDSAVRSAMLARFGKEKTEGCKYDLWSSLALAACASDHLFPKVSAT